MTISCSVEDGHCLLACLLQGVPAAKSSLFRRLFGPEASVAGPDTNRWKMFVPAVLTHMREEEGEVAQIGKSNSEVTRMNG